MKNVRPVPSAIFAAMLFVSSLSTTFAGEKVATFSVLPKGDELEMTYTTSGCFNFAIYELKFQHSDELSVSIVQKLPDASTGRKITAASNPMPLGELRLTKADIEGLDRLLEFYRSKPPGGCTTVDTISISQRHGGKIVASEQFTDGSCSYGRTNLTRIETLVMRLKRPQ